MKKILLLLLMLGVYANWGITQSVSLSCPDLAEVGIPESFTATFDAQNQTGITIIRYEWTTPFNGDGVGGISGIEGSTNGETSFTDPVIIETSSSSSTIPIVWGDFFNNCDGTVEVVVVYEQDGSNFSVSTECSLDLGCVTTPQISGPSSIQNCCNDIVTYCDNAFGEQDSWNWTVSGGSIISGQGTQCIDVRPNNTGNLTVSTTASRSTGLNAYTRSASITVTRFIPETPTITGPRNVCLGQTFEVCHDETLCNYDNTKWSIPSELEVVGEDNEACISLRLLAESNDLLKISATAQLAGGCEATSRNFFVRTGKPEIPSISVVFDPCLFLIYIYDNANYYSGITYEWEVSGLANDPHISNGNPGQLKVLYGEGEVFCVDRVTATNNCGSVVLEGPFCYLTPDCTEGPVPGIPIEGKYCSEEYPCPEGFECIEGRCTLIGDPVEPDCISVLDCGLGYECINGKCVYVGEDECRSNPDCPQGYICKRGVCVPVPFFQNPDADRMLTEGTVQVYPNPVGDKINFDFISSASGIAFFRLYDNMGKEILRLNPSYDLGENHLELSPDINLPQGSLFYSLESKDFNFYGKLINL